jgi:hypothetical protein
MTITQHALLYNFHTSNLFFEEIFFLKFLSMQPLLFLVPNPKLGAALENFETKIFH